MKVTYLVTKCQKAHWIFTTIPTINFAKKKSHKRRKYILWVQLNVLEY